MRIQLISAMRWHYLEPFYCTHCVRRLSFLQQKDPTWNGQAIATVHFRPMTIQHISSVRWHHMPPSCSIHWVEQLSFLRLKDPIWNGRVMATVHLRHLWNKLTYNNYNNWLFPDTPTFYLYAVSCPQLDNKWTIYVYFNYLSE